MNELSDFLARPGQNLQSHLEGVSGNVGSLLPANGTTAHGDDWQTIGRVLAWAHDAGKLTSWFQEYVAAGDRTIAPTEEHTYHGFVSALLTARSLYELDVSAEACTAGFYAVAKHHGLIPNVEGKHGNYAGRGRSERKKQNYRLAREQLEDIDSEAATAADVLLQQATANELGWEDISVQRPEKCQNLIIHPRRLDGHFYETVLRAWSTLVCADKFDAAGVDLTGDRLYRPSVKAVRSKYEGLPEGSTDLERRLNARRSAAHREACETLRERYDDGERLFRLTLPTGFGKTLTGLRASFELAEQQDSRVIYALPYTAIIDQVDETCREVFSTHPACPEYTVHHHLADTYTNLEELQIGDHVSDGSETTFAEAWRSGLVLTTFTQLFESLAGPGNTQSMKLPALQDSIIVLDEPQALSLRWWGLFVRLVRFLTHEYDATLLLMTATQPKILERDDRLPTPVPLTSEFDRCIDFLESEPRVEFYLHESLTTHLEDSAVGGLDMTTAASELWQATGDGENSLAIVNTIESAATLTELLSDVGSEGEVLRLGEGLLEYLRNTPDESESDEQVEQYLDFLSKRTRITIDTTVIATLTTRLRPRDRAILIESLRQILDPDTDTPFDQCSTITVSTQLIEAGIDVSFDRLYRDFAPLPALVQAAGRCNRNFDGSVARVTVWRLAGPDSDSEIPSQLIYGRQSLLRPTKRALRTLRRDADEEDVLSEAAVISNGVDEYYSGLHRQRRTESRSDSLVADFNAARGERLRNASLIDEEYETADVVILATSDDQHARRQFEKQESEEQWAAARKAFDSLKPLLVTLPTKGQSEQSTNLKGVTFVDVTDDLTIYEICTGRGLTYEDVVTAVER